MTRKKDEDDWVRIIEPITGRYTIRDQELIIRHLAACSISAEKALAAEIELAGRDAGIAPFIGRISYWRNVIAAAKLFAYRATTKQTTALSLDPNDIERVRASWNQQTTT